MRFEVDCRATRGAQHLGRSDRYLQAVGFDGLDTHRVVECLSADLEPRIPLSRQGILAGACMEYVDAIDAFGKRLAIVELFGRGVELQRHLVGQADDHIAQQAAVPVVQGPLLVLDNQCQMYLVARPPYAALAVNEALDTLRGLLAADVEPARREFMPAVDLQIGGGDAVRGRHHERITVNLEIGETPLIGPGCADLAHLVVVGRDPRPGPRRGGHEVCYGCPEPVPLRTLDNQTEVRCREVVFGHTIGAHIVARFRGVVAIFP